MCGYTKACQDMKPSYEEMKRTTKQEIKTTYIEENIYTNPNYSCCLDDGKYHKLIED